MTPEPTPTIMYVLLELAKALASARRAGDKRRPEEIVEPVLIAIGRPDLVDLL